MHAILRVGLVLSIGFAGIPAYAGEPVAIVESTSAVTAKLELLQYLQEGHKFKLAADESVVIGYLQSCVHETITGGSVVVGTYRSEVFGGFVERNIVECDAGEMEISKEQAAKSGVTVFRVPVKINSEPEGPVPSLTIYSTHPVVIAAHDTGQAIFQRLDKSGPAITIKLQNGVADLAVLGKVLEPGGIYSAIAGAQHLVFEVDPLAESGKGPIVGRLLRF